MASIHKNLERRLDSFFTSKCQQLFPSARAGAEGWARGEGAGAHAEARGERRGNVAEEVAAAGAMAVAAEGSGEIGAEPVTAGFAERIDALHGETGQVLHLFSLSGRKLRSIRLRPFDGGNPKVRSSPWRPKTTRGKIPGKPCAKKA